VHLSPLISTLGSTHHPSPKPLGNGKYSLQWEDVMSQFYQSLKLKMRDTMPWKKENGMSSVVRVKSSDAAVLNNEMERLERLVNHRIGRLKEAVRAGETIVLEESGQAERLIENLQAEILILKAKLKEAEETIEGKNLAHQRSEENLSVTIKKLQESMQSKDEVLANRDNEIKDCKLKIDDDAKKIGALETVHTKLKEEVGSYASRAEERAKISQQKIAALEAQLMQTEELARQKTSTIKELERQLTTKVQELEGLLQGKEEILIERNSEIADLRSQLKRLTKSISEASLLFKEAEALAVMEDRDPSLAVPSGEASKVEKPHASVQAKPDGKVTPIVFDALPEMVSAETFQNIIRELSQATNVIGPLASIMVHQQAKALGESVEKFPRARLAELLEGLAKEISDEHRQIYFLQQFTQNERMILN